MDKKMSQGERKKLNMLRKALGKLSFAKLSMIMALASLMSLSAFAADGEATGTTMASLITEAGTTLPSLMSLIWNLLTSNPLLSLSLIAAVAAIGFRLLRRARRVVH